MNDFDQKYPQATKFSEVRSRSQVCGEFLEWLTSEKGLTLAKWNLNHEHDDNCTDSHGFHTCDLRRGQDVLYPEHFSTETLLAEFFGIDLVAYEKEKRQMLEECRARIVRRENQHDEEKETDHPQS